MKREAPKIYPFNRGSKRRPNYWLRYSVDGREYREGTKARNLREARAAADLLARTFVAGRWQPPSERADKPNLFADYAPKVIARRIAAGVKSAKKDEGGHVRNHLVPVFGECRLDELTFKAIRDGFAKIESKGHAGRTVRNIHTTLRSILLEAAEDELILHVPPPLTARRRHLPPPLDKDPQWRATAHFEPEELRALLSCEAIETQYRVMYAVYFAIGGRFSEVVALDVRSYDRRRKPLPALTVPAAKRKRTDGEAWRVVPVHPDLRAWLNWWLDERYEVLHGRPPAPTDPLFPTLSPRRQNAGETRCSHGEVYKRWQRKHLPDAGLRHRRLHDARRTFISLARSSGHSDELVRAITHTVTRDKILDAYTTWKWEALCSMMGSVELSYPPVPGERATVVELDRRRAR